MEKGLVQVYTGDGKGKTTAAMGLVIRALGNDFKVRVLQFFKSELSGEVAPIQELGVEVSIHNHQKRPSWTMNKEQEQLLKEDSIAGWNLFEKLIDSKEYDLIILDEANHVLHRGYIEKEEVLRVLDKAINTEVVLTGRNAPDWLIKRADLVTEMKMHKHPFQQKIPARKGIEK